MAYKGHWMSCMFYTECFGFYKQTIHWGYLTEKVISFDVDTIQLKRNHSFGDWLKDILAKTNEQVHSVMYQPLEFQWWTQWIHSNIFMNRWNVNWFSSSGKLKWAFHLWKGKAPLHIHFSYSIEGQHKWKALFEEKTFNHEIFYETNISVI